jgi:hypothetical protein
MLTSEKIEKIKLIYQNPKLDFRDILKESRKIFGKKIAYSTLLRFIKSEGLENRKKLKIRKKND